MQLCNCHTEKKWKRKKENSSGAGKDLDSKKKYLCGHSNSPQIKQLWLV